MSGKNGSIFSVVMFMIAFLFLTGVSFAQLIDKTLSPNTANEGIAKSFDDQVGTGRGDSLTVGSSIFIIQRDPFRSVRRGRQLFQRKFTREQGQGPIEEDGAGDINTNLAIGAGLSDGCASCHGRPRGSAGFGGDVVTRPDSRDAPHLFGLGLKEMLADEITGDLRKIKADAIAQAVLEGNMVTKKLESKGISYGKISAFPNGSVNTSEVEGVNEDLRVRPFFLHGATISMREFIVGAFDAEMGMHSPDPDLLAASTGSRIVTPAGMVLDGSLDQIESPAATSVIDDPDNDGVANEIPEALVDHVEFYLLNYFKAGRGNVTPFAKVGEKMFKKIGCAECHVPDLTIERDRRVADVDTKFDPVNGISFNRLFATAEAKFTAVNDGSGHPDLKVPNRMSFLVKNIFTDFKRHDLGPNFHEINYDGTLQKEFLTMALWGVGSTAPYGHDGRSMDLTEVILRHGGEAQDARDRFDQLGQGAQALILEFLRSLILFPPDDTPSNLNPGNSATAGFPQFGHGSINLGALFNNPLEGE